MINETKRPATTVEFLTPNYNPMNFDFLASIHQAGKDGVDLNEAVNNYLEQRTKGSKITYRVNASQKAFLDAVALIFDREGENEESIDSVYFVGEDCFRLVVDGAELPCDMLDTLLGEVGYQRGPVNVIALLGYLGEMGEVLLEYLKQFHPAEVDSHDITWKIQKIAMDLLWFDNEKKAIRDGRKPLRVPQINKQYPSGFDEQKLIGEMADHFYYKKAIMRSFGVSEQSLAQISLNKVQRLKEEKSLKKLPEGDVRRGEHALQSLA